MSSDPGRWEYFLADSSDLSLIGLLTTATNDQLTLEFNRPGSFSATLPIDDPLTYLVNSRSTCIIAERNGDVKWSGGITSVVDDAVARTTQITAQGWMEELDHRFVHPDDLTAADLNLRIAASSVGWPTSHPTDTDIVALLLGMVNAQKDSDGTARPLHVSGMSFFVSGGVFTVPTGADISTTPRTRTYNLGDNYGQSVRELSDIENGCDLVVDPRTRVVFTRANTAYADRTNAHFSLNADAGTNLQNATRTQDGTGIANRLSVVGSNGVVVTADDARAIDAVGVMLEEWDSLSDVADAAIIGAFANAELVFKRYGITTYSLTPIPSGNVPRLFDDFDLGDRAYFSVDVGRFSVSRQAIRVFSVSISRDAGGNEVFGELGVSPAGS